MAVGKGVAFSFGAKKNCLDASYLAFVSILGKTDDIRGLRLETKSGFCEAASALYFFRARPFPKLASADELRPSSRP